MNKNKTNIIFNSIDNLGKTIQEYGDYSKVFVLVDENTREYCFPLLLQNQDYFSRAEIIEVPVGEEAKTIDIAYQIWGTLLELEADRKTLLVNLGGGVVTDLGGFIASTFKRGIDFVNVPTTLMGQVDAAIGGKTGVNFEKLKNQIGTFANPLFVYIDNQFLNTLSEREQLSGLAEIIKYGLIEEAEIFQLVEENWNSNLPQLIKKCVAIKQRIVENDFTENGERKKLNFGHTIGHGLETLFAGELTHGEAVAQGMLIETYLSVNAGFLLEEKAKKITETITTYFTKPSLDKSQIDQLLAILKHDKKNREGKINFTLLTDIGSSKIDCFIPENTIHKILKEKML